MNELLKEKRIVIGLLAKDCVERLRQNIQRVEELGRMFSDYHVVIYENNSKDGTAQEVKAWGQRNEHVLAISEEIKTSEESEKVECPFPEKSLQRIARMSFLRNRVLDEVEKTFLPDFFCFIDADILDFSPESIVQAMEHAPEDWGGLFANGIVYWEDNNHNEYLRPFQYDSYAFVETGEDYTKRGDFVLCSDFHPTVSYKMMLDINANNYLPCESAFNGIGIYRYEAIKHERYAPYQNDEMKKINASFCEHILFNYKVRAKGYGLYIAREMKVVYQRCQMEDIMSDIVYDYQGLLKKETSMLQPGFMSILQSWKKQRNIISRLERELEDKKLLLVDLSSKSEELQTFKNKPCIQTRDYCNQNWLYRRLIRSNLHLITWIESLKKRK